jgi:hypothetical protein
MEFIWLLTGACVWMFTLVHKCRHALVPAGIILMLLYLLIFHDALVPAEIINMLINLKGLP